MTKARGLPDCREVAYKWYQGHTHNTTERPIGGASECNSMFPESLELVDQGPEKMVQLQDVGFLWPGMIATK